MHYRRTKRDANHKAIVNALRKAGADVLDLAAIGNGCPDLLVYYQPNGRSVLLEVKNPLTRRGQQGTGKTTVTKQAEFRAKWRGPIVTVESIDHALWAIGALNVLHPAA